MSRRRGGGTSYGVDEADQRPSDLHLCAKWAPNDSEIKEQMQRTEWDNEKNEADEVNVHDESFKPEYEISFVDYDRQLESS